MGEIPLAPIIRIMRKANIDRVSDDAADALREILEDKAVEISERAAKFAKHAGRVTIKSEDIRLAK